MEYKVGTRGSALALAQTGMVIKTLNEAYPQHHFSAVTIKTAGDKNQKDTLQSIGGKGLFVTEIEDAMLDGSIHMAVHSMKDMPALPAEGLMFCKAWKRADPRDVLILREKGTLDSLSQGARIGTGSLRRILQLKKLRPDFQFVPIRGNIDTRLRKLREPLPDGSSLDAIVLAAAGLERLGLHPDNMVFLSPDVMLPAPAQGTLAIELRADNEELLSLLNKLSDEDTDICNKVERDFLRIIDGGCHLPTGAYCERTGEGFKLTALFGGEEGPIEKVVLNAAEANEDMAAKAAEMLKEALKEKI